MKEMKLRIVKKKEKFYLTFVESFTTEQEDCIPNRQSKNDISKA